MPSVTPIVAGWPPCAVTTEPMAVTVPGTVAPDGSRTVAAVPRLTSCWSATSRLTWTVRVVPVHDSTCPPA